MYHTTHHSAIRNGGCGNQFKWSTLTNVRTHYYDLDGNRKTGNPIEDYPDGIPGYVPPNLRDNVKKKKRRPEDLLAAEEAKIE